MSTPIGTRLRERHGITVLGVAFHIGFFLVVLASALTLMEHRPTVVNIHAEKVLTLSDEEVNMLVNGIKLVECENDEPASYRVLFQWLRMEPDTVTNQLPNQAPLVPLDTALTDLVEGERDETKPTHVLMESKVTCPGEEPVTNEIGPVLISR